MQTAVKGFEGHQYNAYELKESRLRLQPGPVMSWGDVGSVSSHGCLDVPAIFTTAPAHGGCI